MDRGGSEEALGYLRKSAEASFPGEYFPGEDFPNPGECATAGGGTGAASGAGLSLEDPIPCPCSSASTSPSSLIGDAASASELGVASPSPSPSASASASSSLSPITRSASSKASASSTTRLATPTTRAEPGEPSPSLEATPRRLRSFLERDRAEVAPLVEGPSSSILRTRSLTSAPRLTIGSVLSIAATYSSAAAAGNSDRVGRAGI